MNISRIRITPRQLVAYELGPARMTPTVVEAALSQARRRGYVATFTPPPEAYGQHIIMLLATHPFAAIYRALAPDGSPTPVPIGLVESRTRVPITQMVGGMMLAHYGVATIRVTDRCVILRGTWSKMAHEANSSRYVRSGPRPCWMLVERATGLVCPPPDIDDDLRLRTAYIYDEHAMSVDGLLDGEDSCTPISHWQFSKTQAERDELAPPF